MFSLDDYLQAKVSNAATLLRDGKYNEARNAIDAVYYLLGTKNIIELNLPSYVALPTLINLLTTRAKIYLSFHDYKTAYSILTMIDILTLNKPLPLFVQVKIMLLKSNVMVMPNPVAHSLLILSEALRVAERSGDKRLVSEVYMEMGKFMACEYTALGLSLIRKVETFCKRNRLKNGEIGAKVYRARCSYMLWTHDKYKWVNDRKRFAEETVRVLNSINPKDMQSQYNRDIYYGLKRDIQQYQQANNNGN